jgi:hypothetical protein
MGNFITNKCVDASESLKMSNGLTSVVISLLVLSGSSLAESDHEKMLMVWFASRDQALSGMGTVGFDLNEVPWTVEQFEAEKRFLLAVICRAQSMQDWGRLGYEPRADWALARLEKLAQMIRHFPMTCINPQIALDHQAEWRQDEWVLCPKHGTLQHALGCVICNDDDLIGSV